MEMHVPLKLVTFRSWIFDAIEIQNKHNQSQNGLKVLNVEMLC